MKIFFKNLFAVTILSVIAFVYGYINDPYKEGQGALALALLVSVFYFVCLLSILVSRFISKKGDMRGIALSLLAPFIIFILFQLVLLVF